MTKLLQQLAEQSLAEVGRDLHEFLTKLYPICRSITGDGIRRTLGMIGERISLQISEVPTGTVVFDWTVPKEWNVHDAILRTPLGSE